VDLSTRYLGLSLSNPTVLGACPLTHDVEAIARIVDAGAAAVVMHSLFEEQLSLRAMSHPRHADAQGEKSAVLPSFEYLEQLRTIKRTVGVPVIASLNGASEHGWLTYARQLEEAGADALELNVYHLSTDPNESAVDIEQQLLTMVHNVVDTVRIPVAVKLSPFYSALPNLARQLVQQGAKGLVLFNRFYEPDIDVEALALEPRLRLSDSSELSLRLRWTAALAPGLDASLAVSGGVHTGLDALKAIMAGADVVQLVSAVLQRGPSVIGEILQTLGSWLEAHGYASLAHARGRMDLEHCPDPTYYQRANYLKVLQSYRRA
jgi:dihydroorotate dehydrogenase (fumarate)